MLLKFNVTFSKLSSASEESDLKVIVFNTTSSSSAPSTLNLKISTSFSPILGLETVQSALIVTEAASLEPTLNVSPTILVAVRSPEVLISFTSIANSSASTSE